MARYYATDTSLNCSLAAERTKDTKSNLISIFQNASSNQVIDIALIGANKEQTNMPKKIDKFERISSFSDDESYAELMKLSPKEQVEYNAYMRGKAEHYKKLTLHEEEKIRDIKIQIKKKEEEYKHLEGLH
jgi:hypothetical protein